MTSSLFVLALAFSLGSHAAASKCKPGESVGLQSVKVGEKEVFTNKEKSVSLTFSCPNLTANEVEEMLTVFPERIVVDKNLSYQALESAGDSIARIYFDTTGGKLTQLAVVAKTPKDRVSEIEKLVRKALESVQRQ